MVASDSWKEDYLTDSQWHNIGENYLTDSQVFLFNDWPESDKPEIDCKQSDSEVEGTGSDIYCSESYTPER